MNVRTLDWMITAMSAAIIFGSTTAFAQITYWRSLGGAEKWDVTSATRTKNVVTVWYEDEFHEEQRTMLRKSMGDQVLQIATGRYKTLIDCAAGRIVLSYVSYLDAKGVLVAPAVELKESELEWNSIGAGTKGEALSRDVCKTVK